MQFWRIKIDVRNMKRDELLVAFENRKRALMILPVAFIGWYALDFWQFIVWSILYLGQVSLWIMLLQRLPKTAHVIWFVALLLMVLLQVGMLAWLLQFIWFIDSPAGPVVATLILVGIFVTSISLRTVQNFASYTDVIIELFLLALIPILFWIQGLATSELCVVIAVCILVVVYYLRTLRDIANDRRNYALAREKEAERERMQALGQLTGGVAHDFNNLLTVILGNLELYRMGAGGEELLEEMDAATKKAARLTGQLLSYSRKSVLTPRPVDLARLMTGVAELMERLLPSSIRLEMPVLDGIPPVMLDETKLEPVLINLLVNARDAIPDGGVITVRAVLRNGGGMDAPQGLGARNFVVLTIQDNGTGMPPEVANRVFEPYFTTKPLGVGTGLGLPMARGFLEQSGGALLLNSVSGQGTEVVLWCPVNRRDD